MSTNNAKALAIATTGGAFLVSTPGEYIKHRDETLALSAGIVAVKSKEDQQSAINAIALLEGLNKEIEADRVAIKKPFKEAVEAIDSTAKKIKEPVEKRIDVLRKMVSDFQKEENARLERERQEAERKRQEAEEAAAAEQQRLADLERQRKQAEAAAEVARQEQAAAEEAARVAKGKKAIAEAAAAQAEAARKQAEAAAEQQRIEQERLQAEIDAEMAREMEEEANKEVTETQNATASKSEGASFRRVVTFEVTDIEAFYEWDRRRRDEGRRKGRVLESFVKLEVIKSKLNSFINLATDDMLDGVKGIKFDVTTTTAVKAISPTAFKLHN